MKFIDTHCHIYYNPFDEDRDEMIQRAINQNVTQFLLPNVDGQSIKGMYELCKKYPDNCFAMMGLHPCEVKTNYTQELQWVEQYLFETNNEFSFSKFYAVGEIGLDYYWDKSTIPQQKDAFIKQIEWAKKLKLPIAVHARDSLDDILEIIEQQQDGSLCGVLHCFTGNTEHAKKALTLGFNLGIGGVVTYKNSGLDKVIATIGIENVILETDAPYLTPVPHRGKRNECAYIKIIAEKLAEICQLPLQEVAATTTKNAEALFKL